MKHLYIAKLANGDSILALAENKEALRGRIKSELTARIVSIREMQTFALSLTPWEDRLCPDIYDSATQYELAANEYKDCAALVLSN
jgi:hypothetical protein